MGDGDEAIVAEVSRSSSPVLSRRNTFIYNSDSPSPPETPVIVDSKGMFGSFDATAFPPLEPMVNPFESESLSTSFDSLNIPNIVQVSNNPFDELSRRPSSPPEVAAPPPAQPIFAVESITVHIDTPAAPQSALFDLFTNIDANTQLDDISQAPVPVTITITTTADEINMYDSDASSTFPTAHGSEISLPMRGLQLDLYSERDNSSGEPSPSSSPVHRVNGKFFFIFSIHFVAEDDYLCD